MDITYFQKINSTYKSSSKQDTDLYLLNRHVDERFADTIDYHVVSRNRQPFELIITRDTEGNAFKKKIKSRHSEPFSLGDYIEWNGQHWLVVIIDPDGKAYHSGFMYLCTVPLRWQNSNGEIIERWAYSEDFTRYSSGVTGNSTLQIGDNQYGLTLPIDSETRKLHRDMRFAIDFDDAEKPDIYMLTNKKVNLNNVQYFGRGGTMMLTVSFDSFNKDLDRRMPLDSGLLAWICDYHSPAPQLPIPDETTDLFAHIHYSGSNIIRIGGNVKKFTASLTDKNGDSQNMNPIWTVDPDINLAVSIVDGELRISCSNEDLDQTEIVITVKDEHSGFKTSVDMLLSVF